MKQNEQSKGNTTRTLPSKEKDTNTINNYGKDPFFVKKAEQAKKRIERVGFPKEFLS